MSLSGITLRTLMNQVLQGSLRRCDTENTQHLVRLTIRMDARAVAWKACCARSYSDSWWICGGPEILGEGPEPQATAIYYLGQHFHILITVIIN